MIGSHSNKHYLIPQKSWKWICRSGACFTSVLRIPFLWSPVVRLLPWTLVPIFLFTLCSPLKVTVCRLVANSYLRGHNGKIERAVSRAMSSDMLGRWLASRRQGQLSPPFRKRFTERVVCVQWGEHHSAWQVCDIFDFFVIVRLYPFAFMSL